MSEHEGHAARAVYDHEVDDPRLTGRRRAVADWGVGEELFDRMPRRRFRPNDAHRRDVHRTGRFEPVEREEPRAARSMADEPTGRVDEAPRRERLDDEPTGRMNEAPRRERLEAPRPERADAPRRERVDAPRRERADDAPRRERVEGAVERFDPPPPRAVGVVERVDEVVHPPRLEEPPPIAPIDPVAPPVPLAVDDMAPPTEGRRTVVIRGRGADPTWTPHRRPPRTVGERVGPRPDRVAAWAVALGMLLILIAILTAHG